PRRGGDVQLVGRPVRRSLEAGRGRGCTGRRLPRLAGADRHPPLLVQLFRALPAKPAQTVYLGVEAFWLNARYPLPDTDPSAYHLAEYLVSRSAFTTAFTFVRQAHYILYDRWRKEEIGPRCVIGRI